MATEQITVRTARLADAAAIVEITALYAEKGVMLERGRENIVENIRNFFVAECGGEIIGSCAISFFTRYLAEIRTLAVVDAFRRRGVGSILVHKAAFVLTLAPDFFDSLGYRAVEQGDVPLENTA